jgi:hypothetical protein
MQLHAGEQPTNYGPSRMPSNARKRPALFYTLWTTPPHYAGELRDHAPRELRTSVEVSNEQNRQSNENILPAHSLIWEQKDQLEMTLGSIYINIRPMNTCDLCVFPI